MTSTNTGSSSSGGNRNSGKIVGTDPNKNFSWLEFMRGAGLGGNYFEIKYASIFEENRIQSSMLEDLDKDCLKDMGITPIGDIIAITKHAQRILKQQNKSRQDVPEAHVNRTDLGWVPIASASTTVSGTSASTNIKHNPVVPASTASASGAGRRVTMHASSDHVTTTTPPLAPPSKATAPDLKMSVGLNQGKQAAATTTTTTMKRIVIQNKRGTSSSSSDSSDTGADLRLEVPLQKKVRVLPEHEGKYVVKMPQGTSATTKKLLLANRLGPSRSSTTLTGNSSGTETLKRTIFQRLDDASSSAKSTTAKSSARMSSNTVVVSSTQDSKRPRRERDYSDSNTSDFEPREEIRDSRSNSSGRATSRDAGSDSKSSSTTKKSSVFERLGGRGKDSGSGESFSSSVVKRDLRDLASNSSSHEVIRSRMRSDFEIEGRRKSLDSGIKSRLGRSDPDSPSTSSTRKITRITRVDGESVGRGDSSSMRVGQVLSTTRGFNQDGKPVTRRLIVKRIPTRR